MGQTRRQLLRSVLPAVVGVYGLSTKSEATPSSRINTHKKQGDDTMITEAYLTPPSMCFSTLFSNLPSILGNASRHEQPIILMDTYDLKRLHARAVRETDNQEVRLRWALCQTLIQQGILHSLDYAKYYSATKQDRNIQAYWSALESLPEHVTQHAARQSSETYLEFCQGEYMKPFMTALGNWELNTERRTAVEKHQQKLQSGVEDPISHNERVFGKNIAALEVKHAANQQLPINIVSVLGQGEQSGISTIVRESSFEIDPEILALDHEQHGIEQIGRPDHSVTGAYHDMFSSIATVARETTGVQHEDWYLLGSRLAVPLFPDLFTGCFGPEGISTDHKAIVNETETVLKHLESVAETNTPNHLGYAAERIAESNDMISEASEINTRLDIAADLSNQASELRHLYESQQFSPGALYTAATISMDPKRKYDREELFKQLATLEDAPSYPEILPADLERFNHRGGFRRGKKITNWHQKVGRAR